jgi:hypothetical protein
MVEAPIVLWVVLIVFTFPLINFATVALRSYFVYTVIQAGALQASRAHTYKQPADGETSALDVLNSYLPQHLASFSQIKLTSVEPEISITNIASGNQSSVKGPLPSPGDTSVNLYEIRVTSSAIVEPLISAGASGFGAIPGLSAPMTIRVSVKNYVECPECWNI